MRHIVVGEFRLVGIFRIVEIKLDNAVVGVHLVADRRVEPFGERDRAADVGGELQHRIGLDEFCTDDIDRIACGRRCDPRLFGLRLIEHRQRTAA